MVLSRCSSFVPGNQLLRAPGGGGMKATVGSIVICGRKSSVSSFWVMCVERPPEAFATVIDRQRTDTDVQSPSSIEASTGTRYAVEADAPLVVLAEAAIASIKVPILPALMNWGVTSTKASIDHVW